MTAGWCSRTVRAAVFAAVCVVLAALAHVMMSGTHLPAWAFALGAVATGAVGWALAARERGLPLIVATVVATQVALHTAFSHAQSIIEGTPARGTGAGGAAGSMGMSHMSMYPADMSMSRMSMDHMSTSHSAMSHAVAPDGAPSYGMLAAHLFAAVVTGLWLAYGEKAAFRIMRAIAGRLAAPLLLLLGFKVTTDHPRIRVPRSRSRRVRGLLLVHAITSRGPPPGTAVI
ncbi:hypothetical protein [Streptomyces seoulensis]|uniref:hypothetical protein n=1 Tax=Streptomyces seoulensis TaxID=73044 RepID=UPI001FCBAC8D|nr:hypothetical protein [Streptomyces seoulensis]BDH05759.1 hypothetical protein HEK131_29860 [Streptomyces seoulensis]